MFPEADPYLAGNTSMDTIERFLGNAETSLNELSSSIDRRTFAQKNRPDTAFCLALIDSLGLALEIGYLSL